jgi:uncharacterized membrane protein
VTGLVVAGAAVIWAAMLPAAAYAAALPAEPWPAQLLALAVYGLGSAICHQRDERSFHLFAVQLPVCARCTGIYAGAALAALSYVWRSRPPMVIAAESRTRTARRLLAVAALPMAASLVYEWTTGDVPSNLLRAGTGVVLGGAVAHVILAAVDSTR